MTLIVEFKLKNPALIIKYPILIIRTYDSKCMYNNTILNIDLLKFCFNYVSKIMVLNNYIELYRIHCKL